MKIFQNGHYRFIPDVFTYKIAHIYIFQWMSRISGIFNEMNKRTFLKERKINKRCIDFLSKQNNNNSTNPGHVRRFWKDKVYVIFSSDLPLASNYEIIPFQTGCARLYNIARIVLLNLPMICHFNLFLKCCYTFNLHLTYSNGSTNIVFGAPVTFDRPIFDRPIFGRPIFGRPIFGRPIFGVLIHDVTRLRRL